MESLPVSRPVALALAGLAVGALAVAGRWVAQATAPEAEPPARLERAAPQPRPRLVVHVVGAVRRPGLYRLRDGSRIADALARAGGATAKADLALVNLAAPLADGTQVVVPRRAPPAAAGAGGEAAADAGSATGPVRLSTATVEELDALPGIGPVTAQKIVDWRQRHGAFASVDELDAVPGIGPARLEQLRELVTP